MEQQTTSSDVFDHQTGTFASKDAELFYQQWVPKNDPKSAGTFILAHGLGDHSGHMMTLVRHFVPQGFKVYGFDYRGHGNSPGKKGHIDSWDTFRSDLQNFVAFVKEKEPNSPIVMFGNSMGGLMTIEYLQRTNSADIVAAVVNAPALDFIDIGAVSGGALKMLSYVVPSYQIDAGLDSTKLTRDEELQKENSNDKLVHSFATPSLFRALLNTSHWTRSHPELLKKPVLMIQGDSDPTKSNQKFMQKVVELFPHSKFYSVKDGRHEAFNELNREEVFKEMSQWLTAKL